MGDGIGEHHQAQHRIETGDHRLDLLAASLPLVEHLGDRRAVSGVHLGLGPRIARQPVGVSQDHVGGRSDQMGDDVTDTPARCRRRELIQLIIGNAADEVADAEAHASVDGGVIHVGHGRMLSTIVARPARGLSIVGDQAATRIAETSSAMVSSVIDA
ncbi:MAG: hypothetical protein M5T61_14095 [Acidimicrobiia bacterium]|nr:hypothetical protein [Acidimicrobiia bacterium]